MTESIVSKHIPVIDLNCFDLKTGMTINIYECLDSDVSTLNLLDGFNNSQHQYGVYFCVRSITCADGSFTEIVYIGKTIDLKSRMINHHKKGALKLLRVQYIYFVSFDRILYSESNLLCAERKYIKAINPILNDLNHSKLFLNDKKYLEGNKGFAKKKKTNKKLVLKFSAIEMMLLALEFIYFIPDLFLDFLFWQTEREKHGNFGEDLESINPSGYALALKHGWTGELMDVVLHEEMFANCLVYAEIYCRDNQLSSFDQLIDETIVFNAILKGLALLSIECKFAYESIYDSDSFKLTHEVDKIAECAKYYASKLFYESDLLGFRAFMQSLNPKLK